LKLDPAAAVRHIAQVPVATRDSDDSMDTHRELLRRPGNRSLVHASIGPSPIPGRINCRIQVERPRAGTLANTGDARVHLVQARPG
jgi:hypothetical protein